MLRSTIVMDCSQAKRRALENEESSDEEEEEIQYTIESSHLM